MTTETVDLRIEERATTKVQALEAQRLAQLRAEAVAEIAEEEAEAERWQRLEQFVAELPARIDAAPVEAAEKRMAKAISEYVAACRERSDVFNGAWSFIQHEGGGSATNDSMTVNGRTWRFIEADPKRGIAAAAKAAIGEHFGPRASTQLDRN